MNQSELKAGRNMRYHNRCQAGRKHFSDVKHVSVERAGKLASGVKREI